MPQFELPLDTNQIRPVISLPKYSNIKVLIDTGATIPVWVIDENILIKLFNARDTGLTESFGGFGGCVQGKIYEIDLELGFLRFSKLKIIASPLPKVGFHMIFSASMFKGLKYEIDNINNKFIVKMIAGDNSERKLNFVKENGVWRTYILGDHVNSEANISMNLF